MKNYGTGIAYPEAFVTKGKQRVKQFGGTVYLKDGDNFEIEIFNPTAGYILAKISLDGKLISHSGLILRPGERVFLERYLDSNNKFLYSTYEVSGNNPVVQHAIKSNGNVKVEFFGEIPAPRTFYGSGTTITLNNPNPTWVNTFHTGTPVYGTPTNTISAGGTFNGTVTASAASFNSLSVTPTAFYANTDMLSMDNSFQSDVDMEVEMEKPKSFGAPTRRFSKKIETGTVEKGEASKQKFETCSRDFYSFAFHTSEWKILPASQKPMTSDDLKQYCTNCSKKIEKSTYKFCPNCGEKIE